MEQVQKSSFTNSRSGGREVHNAPTSRRTQAIPIQRNGGNGSYDGPEFSDSSSDSSSSGSEFSGSSKHSGDGRGVSPSSVKLVTNDGFDEGEDTERGIRSFPADFGSNLRYLPSANIVNRSLSPPRSGRHHRMVISMLVDDIGFRLGR